MPQTNPPNIHALATALLAQNTYVATAESCTGGGLAALLTSQAGSSAWFDRSFVTYSNAAKTEMLGVPAELIDEHGAVSEPVARAMATGALANSHADLTVAITGIAGPDGGSADKPVGTVWFAWAKTGQPTMSEVQCFAGDRAGVQQVAITYALNGLIQIAS